ncbi:cytochrome P450 3A24-like [Centruroides sculpturatus]|uniref:cytochrome P450 3A24-like n=1 Tax=Centruroides sculpturatus TaxID=218467 RepID=UPI000C6E32E7|nr:cytochrome P450 3A24-like [Centruroides sculpturatus]
MELLEICNYKWFIFFVLVLLLSFLYVNRYFKFWERHRIPTPTTNIWSFLSELYRFMNTPLHLVQTENYKKYGRLYGIFFGLRPQLIVADPQIIKKIIVKDFNMFRNRMKFNIGNPIFDNGLVILGDEDWERIRCIMSPTFTSSRMKQMAYLVKECAEKFTENLKKMVLSNENQSIDCKSYLIVQKFNIGNPIFDNGLVILGDEDWERIRCIMSPTFTSSRMKQIMKIFKVDPFAGTIDFFKEFALHVMKRREEEKTKTDDFLQLLMDAQKGILEISPEDSSETNDKDESNFKTLPKHKTMSLDEMLAQCILFLFAGSETTTNTLAFIIYHMALNPECQNKLIEEIDEVNKNNKEINFDVLFKMQYMDAVVNESFRKEPIGIQMSESPVTFTVNRGNMYIIRLSMSLDEMLAQCVLFLFAGIETTTNTLAFVVYYMALNPECQNKLIEGIDEVGRNTKEINFDALFEMHYMDAVINETLRKKPVTAQLIRECTEEYELSEICFKVPKGMSIAVPVYSIHHDREFYPNPEKFNPDRFLPENRNSILPYTYLPFGEGPRNCIGMRFAIMVVKMLVFHLFRDFRVLATEETKKPLEFFKGQGVIQPKKLIVQLEKRK